MGNILEELFARTHVWSLNEKKYLRYDELSQSIDNESAAVKSRSVQLATLVFHRVELIVWSRVACVAGF
jgi:hypothetical protein